MLRGFKQIFVHQDPETPTETSTELCLSASCGRTGEQCTAAGAGALGAVGLGVASDLYEEVAINPTIKPPKLTQDCRAQIKPCAHQDPGERNSDPTRD